MQEFMRYIVPKGFICVDGTSLTVCDVTESTFTFMLIEHTQNCVIIPSKEVGDAVNLEVDVLAKMVEQSVSGLNEQLKCMTTTIEAQKAALTQLTDNVRLLQSRIEQLEQQT
jgi:riboflavin synthase